MEKKQLKLKFLGAAREVTGSKTQIRYKNHTYLIDCGMYQGDKELRALNREDFPHAQNVDGVLLTHAHIDHSGYLPRLVQQGFRGPIYCTAACAALLKVLLTDSAYLETEDAEYANRKGYSSHKPAVPLFTIEDVERTMHLVKIVNRDEWIELTSGLSFRMLRSGHLLGSSFIQVSFDTGAGSKLVTFSGDLGSHRSHVIKGPVTISESDYLVLEGTYGDKVHKYNNIQKNLAKAIKKVNERRGVLVIPAFAVGRTQELLYLINDLEDQKLVPKLPLYIDSPMALKATQIYKAFVDDLRLIEDNKRFLTSLEESRFKASLTSDDSKRLTSIQGPMIVISAAGMLTGGRILHHLKVRLPDSANIILFVGFQANGTKGRLLQNGMDSIRIHHEEIEVNAEIMTLEGISAHADSKETIEWVKHFKGSLKRIFLNHGERDPLKALKYRLEHELGYKDVEIPHLNQEYVLD